MLTPHESGRGGAWRRPATLGHVYSLAYASIHAARYRVIWWQSADGRHAEQGRVLAIATEHGFSLWSAWAGFTAGGAIVSAAASRRKAMRCLRRAGDAPRYWIRTNWGICTHVLCRGLGLGRTTEGLSYLTRLSRSSRQQTSAGLKPRCIGCEASCCWPLPMTRPQLRTVTNRPSR